MQTVRVDLGERSYPICIGRGRWRTRARACRSCARPARRGDHQPGGGAALPRAASSRSLRAGFEPTVIEVPDGEEHKNLAWLTFLYDRLIDAAPRPRLRRSSRSAAASSATSPASPPRPSCAACRSCRCRPRCWRRSTRASAARPAVNHPAGKNLIGAFYQPRLVWIDVDTLRTLPRREVQAGTGRGDQARRHPRPDAVRRCSRRSSRASWRSTRRCCIEVVRAELRHQGGGGRRGRARERTTAPMLNFGHTVGHAIEMLTEYRRYLHGEAVAIGMAFAARLSHARGHCNFADGRTGRPAAASAHSSRSRCPRTSPAGLSPSPSRPTRRPPATRFVSCCIDEIGQTRFDIPHRRGDRRVRGALREGKEMEGSYEEGVPVRHGLGRGVGVRCRAAARTTRAGTRTTSS